MDTLTQQQRRANMAAIHSKDTKPEMVVRRFLWRRGYRYRVNHPRLPGKPDIVMLKYRTCIFVNGCFWHGHNITFDPSYPADNEKSCSPTLGVHLLVPIHHLTAINLPVDCSTTATVVP